MKEKKFSYTKILVFIYSLFFLIWITLSYILAFMDKTYIAEELSSQVVMVGIATVLGYFLKAYFETREMELNRLTRELSGIEEICEEECEG